jgi:isoamylase
MADEMYADGEVEFLCCGPDWIEVLSGGAYIDTRKEWNGRFRDDTRSFFRGEQGLVGLMANRLLGSRDIYGHQEREAEQSVNFVTCHDGFTLNDLVSYNQKHNETNGKDRRHPTLQR